MRECSAAQRSPRSQAQRRRALRTGSGVGSAFEAAAATYTASALRLLQR